MKKIIIIIIAFATFEYVKAQQTSKVWSEFSSNFLEDWSAMRLNPWPLDYKSFFEQIPTNDQLIERETIITRYKKLLTGVERTQLNSEQKLHYDHIVYYLGFHQSLNDLSKKFITQKKSTIHSESIFEMPDHKEWYELFVRKYTSLSIRPDSVFDLGLAESNKLFKKLKSLQPHLKDKHQWIQDTAEISKTYHTIEQLVKEKLKNIFPLQFFRSVPVRPINPSSANTPPGYYSDNGNGNAPLFYYNYYNGQHDASDAAWLYLHEAVPGHHLQALMVGKSVMKPFFQDLIRYEYNGWFEGWACYIEEYGYAAGVYADNKREYAYLRWNLIRSMRLCIDVGINYYGWSTEKAKDFWNKYLPEEPELREREIARCMRWPAQALSYIVGSVAIQQMKANYLSSHKSKTEKEFHQELLNYGMVPLEILSKHIQNSR